MLLILTHLVLYLFSFYIMYNDHVIMGSHYITINICCIMHNQALDDLKMVYFDRNM